jgi:outer membrane cobalamin receptor
MSKLKTLLIFLITFQSAYSQRCSVSGYVEDITTGERIIGAYVIDSVSRNVTQTNDYGFYNFKLFGKKAALQATFSGLKSKVTYLSLVHDTLLNISMQPVKELKEVVIESSLYKHNVNNSLGLITIPIKNLTSIPSLGESDLLKSIQSQPGIKGGVEGSSGIFVRGGSGGENLFMLDDVPMYNVNHLYGFFSTFNSSAVKDIKLVKGCFPARYGGRASSVIDVHSRDGNNKSIKGEISLGIISSRFTIEGPLFSEKTTFLVSGRRSYFDLYSGTLKKLNILDKDFPGYYFYDLSAMVTHTFSQNNKLFLSIYKGKDHIKYSNGTSHTSIISESFSDYVNETSGWGNLLCSLRWNHTFSNGLFENTTIAYSRYYYSAQDKFNSMNNDSILVIITDKNYSASYKSSISDLMVKTDFDFSLSDSHKLSSGYGITFHSFNPGVIAYSITDKELNEKIDTSFANNIVYTSEPFFYAQDEINLKKLKIDAGLRFSGLLLGRKTNFNAEPRLSASFSILPMLVIKTGYSRMVQYLHLLSSLSLNMPTDIWIPASNGLRPLKSDQVNAGISCDLDNLFLISIEIYRKWLSNTADYRNGSSLLGDLSPWYEKTTQGNGNAKGIELTVEKQKGRITGSLNYTISVADRKFVDLNNGKTFPFIYDRLHDFNIFVNYRISEKWDFSALLIYGTGYPVTTPVDKYSPAIERISVFPINYYPSINNSRLPNYNRLDISIHYKTINRLGENILSLDIFNVYNHKNPVNMYFNYICNAYLYTYLLPVIPSVTYTLKFK